MLRNKLTLLSGRSAAGLRATLLVRRTTSLASSCFQQNDDFEHSSSCQPFTWKLYSSRLAPIKPATQPSFVWRAFEFEKEFDNDTNSTISPITQPLSVTQILGQATTTTMTGFDLFAREFLAKPENKPELLYETSMQLTTKEKKMYSMRAKELQRFNRMSAYKCFLVHEQKRKLSKFREEKALEKWNAMEPLRKKQWQQLAECQSTLKRKQMTGFQYFTREYFAENKVGEYAFKELQKMSCTKWHSFTAEEKQKYSNLAKVTVVPPTITRKRGVSGWDLFRKEKFKSMNFQEILQEWNSSPEVKAPFIARAKEMNKPKEEQEISELKVFKIKVFKEANAKFRASLSKDITGLKRQEAFWGNLSNVMKTLGADFNNLTQQQRDEMMREYHFSRKLKQRQSKNRGFYYD